MSRRTGRPPGAATAFLAALVVLAPAAARGEGDVQLTAEVDAAEIGPDDQVTLVVTLKAGESPSQVVLPGSNQKDFEVVSQAQSQQTSMSLTGGSGFQVVRVHRWTLLLKPLRTGTLVIPGPKATVAGKRHEHPDIRVRVLASAPKRPGAQPPRALPGEDGEPPGTAPRGRGWRGWERDVALRVVLDRKEAWLGEQVTATIELVAPVPVLSYDGYRAPSLEGFWSEALATPTTLEYRLETVQGVPSRVYLLKKLALFPTRAGRLTVEPVEADVRVQLGSQDPFGVFPEVRRVQRRSEPVSVEVRPLPSEGVPDGFQSVNVGSYELEVQVPEKRIAAGQAAAVRMVVRGQGNVRSLALPRLGALPGAKAFDPTTSDQVGPQGDRFGGTRTVETVVVPERTGELVVPAIAWPYFDPRTGRYAIAQAPEQRLEVGAAGGPAAVGGAEATNTLAAGLRPLREEHDIVRGGPPPWRSPLFLILLAGPALAFLGAVSAAHLRARRSQDAGPRRHRQAGRRARRRLAGARAQLAAGDAPGFHDELSRALHDYAADKLGRPVGSLTRDELVRTLASAGADPAAVAALAAALDACDAGRFGRGGERMAEVLAEAERAMGLLEASDWTSGGRAA